MMARDFANDIKTANHKDQPRCCRVAWTRSGRRCSTCCGRSARTQAAADPDLRLGDGTVRPGGARGAGGGERRRGRPGGGAGGAGAGCQALHVRRPAWAGSGLGEPPSLGASMAAAGTAPIAVGDMARLLLKMLATPGLPGRVGLHGPGRVAGPRPGAGRRPGPGVPGRFLDEVKVHYPGIELVCDARLSLASDPYLADYRVDGLPVLAPAMAIEAMAQGASALAGRPLRQVTGVTLERRWWCRRAGGEPIPGPGLRAGRGRQDHDGAAVRGERVRRGSCPRGVPPRRRG